MRIHIGFLIFLAFTTAQAENQFALVDSINTKYSLTHLSLDVSSESDRNEAIVLSGQIWNNKHLKSDVKPIEVSVNKSILEIVEVNQDEITFGNQSFKITERVFQVGEQIILRKLLVSDDESTFMSISDDPGPLAVAAAIAGTALAVCSAKVIYDMFKCSNGSAMKLSASLKGVECKSECK